MLFSQNPRQRSVFRLFYPESVAMTRFGVISDVYGLSDQVTISNSVDRLPSKSSARNPDFGFSWMTQSQIHSEMRGA
jgi:hypothetical protein